MKIETIPVSSFAMNCYLVADPESGEAIYIDPGAEADLLIEKISNQNFDLKFVINTHCHVDHTAEVSRVIDYFKVPFYIHQGDLALLENLLEQGNFFGLNVQEIPKITDFVKDGDSYDFGNLTATILHTPGHSPGGISIKIENSVFVGDCLFMDSIGRTDLPGGNYDQLISSIKTKLLTLDDSMNVYPGHGPATTIGRERENNPFLQQ
jgi:glyoxylase-like metal-dependent hydrolase (beta-lactamase superfamily II)